MSKSVTNLIEKGVPLLPIEGAEMIATTLLLVVEFEVQNKKSVFSKESHIKMPKKRYLVLDKLLSDPDPIVQEFKNLIKMRGYAYNGYTNELEMAKKEHKMLYSGTFDNIMTVDEAVSAQGYWP